MAIMSWFWNNLVIIFIVWSLVTQEIEGREGLSIKLNQIGSKQHEMMSDSRSYFTSHSPSFFPSSFSSSSSSWITSGSGRNYATNHSSDGIELLVQTNGKTTPVERRLDSSRYSHHASSPDIRLLRGKEGDSITIEVQEKEKNFQHVDHRVTFEWFKDGQSLQFGPRVKLITRNKLKITSLQRSDRGVYQVLVKKEEGTTESSLFQLHLEEQAPEFRETFHSRSLYPGSSLNLKCTARGSPLPQIRWFRYERQLDHDPLGHGHRSRSSSGSGSFRIADYVDDEGAIISHLNISSVQVEDGGLYTCEAVNELAGKRHSALIQIYGSPIIHSMENKSIVTSGKLTVDCPVSGFPISEIHWKKDGKEMQGGQKRIRTLSNGTLAINEAHLEDEGWFKCEARNKEGRLASGSFFLDVVEKPVINPFLFGADLREGMRTTVVCSILSGELPISITWFKDGQLLASVHPDAETVRLGDFTASLKISNIKRRHSGNYTCRASHSNFPHIFSTFTSHMTVLASPSWVIRPKASYTVLRRKNLVIDCQAEGIPSPTHQWKKMSNLKGQIGGQRSENGNEMNADEADNGLSNSGTNNNPFVAIVSGPHMHVLENGSLAIIDAEKSDEAEYLCESSNGIGPGLSVSTLVHVRTPPSFDQNYEILKTTEGAKVTLTCNVYGDEPMKIVWSKEREVLNPSFMGSGSLSSSRHQIQEVSGDDGVTKSSRLTIDEVQVADSSNFYCAASNSFGSEVKTLKLLVQSAPQPPNSLIVANVSSRAVTLIWVPGHDGNSQIIAYNVQFIPLNGTWTLGHGTVMMTEKDQHLATVSGLEPSTSYRFRILAENSFGRSRPTAEVVVKTDEEAPNQVPTNVRIETLSSKSIRVTWLMPTSPFRNYDGFYVGYKPVTNESPFVFKTMDLASLGRSSSGKNEYEAILSDLKRSTRYSIMIQAFNRKGSGPSSEEIMAQTNEFDVPATLNVKAMTIDHHSLSLSWDTSDTEPVTGYVISYRNSAIGGGSPAYAASYAEGPSQSMVDGDLWQEVKIIGKKNSFVLENLKCGSQYQVTVAPFNKAGKADPSPVVTAATAGSAPSPPNFGSLVSTNSTHGAINLSAWSDNGCPIMYFVVQYKERLTSEWIMLSNNIIPEQAMVYISDLFPSTWYDLAMTAYSEAGHREAQYVFSTLTPAGATISPLTTDAPWSLAIYDSVLVAPLICTCVVLLAVCATVAYFMTASKGRNDAENLDHCKFNFRSPLESELFPNDSTIGSRKMERVSMTSIGLKNMDPSMCPEHMNEREIPKNQIYDLPHRGQGNGVTTFYQSSFVTPDHRIVGIMSDGGDFDLGCREVILERHRHPARSCSNGGYELAQVGQRNKLDQTLC